MHSWKFYCSRFRTFLDRNVALLGISQISQTFNPILGQPKVVSKMQVFHGKVEIAMNAIYS